MKEFVTERIKLVNEDLKRLGIVPGRLRAIAEEAGVDVSELELVRKYMVADKVEIDKDARAVTSYINTAAKDRDNEIIEPEGAILTHYRKNPVVSYGHDYRGLPVAKNIWIKKDKKGLLAKTVFLKHSMADDVYRLYSEDVAGTGPAMKAWSIGFIPLKWEESPEGKDKPPKEGEADIRPRRTYKKWELLEYSAVMIPSNREALTEMVAKGLIKSEKLKEEIAECVGDECAVTVTKPEETNDFIRIPVRDCKVTATITISEKQGITALYCGKIKKIRTYIFDKRPPFSWTMKKAQAWVKEHGKAVDGRMELFSKEYSEDSLQALEEFVNMDSQSQLETVLKDGGVFELEETTTNNLDTGTVLDDTGTYGNDITKEAQKARDSLKDTELLNDEDVFGKRPDLQGNPSIWDIMDAIEGAVNAGVIGHRRKWVTDLYPVNYPSGNVIIGMREEEVKYYLYPYTYDDGEISFGEATELEQTYKPKQTEREQRIAGELFDRTTAQLNKIEEELKALKEGRVLSAKNRKLVKQCADMLMVLYEATEPPQREEFELEEGDPILHIEDDKNGDKILKPKEQNGDKLDIEPDKLVDKIASVLKANIEELVANKIKKMRGKVE